MKILVFSYHFPFPIDSGTKYSTVNIIRTLSVNHEVHLIAYRTSSILDEAAAKQYCRKIFIIDRPKPSAWQFILNIFNSTPWSINKNYSIASQKHIREMVRNERYDIILLENIPTYKYYYLINGRSHIYVYAHNVEYLLQEDFMRSDKHPLRRLYHWLEVAKTKRYEHDIYSKADKVLVVSEQDRQALIRLGIKGNRICVLPVGMDIQHIPFNPTPPRNKNIIYVGSFTYRPNLDTLEQLAGKIMPKLITTIKDLKLFVVGGGLPARYIENSNYPENIEYCGYVDSVSKYYKLSRIAVLPIRQGGGIKLKIIEALAHGCPVITTVKGAEGLSLRHGETAMIANSDEELIEYAKELLIDDEKWIKLSKAGRAFVEKYYSWEYVGKLIDKIFA